jgi:excisionase family DNA binding protein
MCRPLDTPEELAAVLRLEVSTVHRLAREKRIPSIRVTRKSVRFVLADVLAALGVRQEVPVEARGQEAAAPPASGLAP